MPGNFSIASKPKGFEGSDRDCAEGKARISVKPMLLPDRLEVIPFDSVGVWSSSGAPKRGNRAACESRCSSLKVPCNEEVYLCALRKQLAKDIISSSWALKRL